MKWCLTALSVLCLAGLASAQSCSSHYGRAYSIPQSYSYVAPAKAVTYAAPVKTVYSYKENYAHDAYFLRLTAFFPVLDVPTYGAAVYAPPLLTQTQPQAPAKATGNEALLQQIVTQQTQLLTEVKKLSEDVKKVDDRVGILEKIKLTPQAPAPQARQREEQPEQVPVPPKEVKPPQGKEGDVSSKARTVAQQKCAACHASGREDNGGGFVMLDKDGRFTAWTDKEIKSMQKHLLRKTMPPQKGKLAEALKIEALKEDEAQALFDETLRQVAAESK